MASTATLAAFAAGVSYDRLPDSVRTASKQRVLDAIGAGVGATGRRATDAVRRAVAAQNVSGRSRLWGTALSASPSDAALYNATLLGAGNGAVFFSPTLASPTDSIAAVLVASEAYSSAGEDVLAGVAAACEIHGELSWNVPLDGFGPPTHSALAATAGVGRAIGLDADTVTSALDIVASRPSMASERASDFDAVAGGFAAQTAVNACILADSGVDGPVDTDDCLGRADLDFDPGCDRVHDVAVLPYDVHPHAQAAIEVAIELTETRPFDPADIDSVRVETYDDAVAHVTPAAVAAALVDRELTRRPTDRVDLEPVAAVVSVESDDSLTDRFERGETPARVRVVRKEGESFEREQRWFTGHPAAPASWGVVEDKFDALASERYDEARRREILGTVSGLEAETAAELCRLLD